MDAKYYNGGPDEGSRLPSYGRTREADPVEDLRGKPCGCCGLPMHSIYTLAGVGAFCSPKCRTKGPRQVRSEVA